MTYRHDKKRTSVTPKIILIVLGFLLALLCIPRVRTVVRPVFVSIMRPVLSLGTASHAGVQTSLGYFSTKSQLIAENTKLHEDNQMLEEKVVAFDALEVEYQNLLKEIKRTDGRQTTVAHILAKPGVSPYDTLLIDTGHDEGVAVGDLVFAGDYVGIGTVTEVTAHTALVTLYSTTGIETIGRIEGKNIDATLTGRGGGNFTLSLPSDVTLVEGTRVLLPASHVSLLAIVGARDMSSRTANNTYLLTTPINIHELALVRVVKH